MTAELLINETATNPAVRSAVQRLVLVSRHGDASLISLPMHYPSGTSIGVRVRPSGKGFLVSDFGCAYREAEQNGYEITFMRQAKEVARSVGVEFTDDRQFQVRATAEQLPVAIGIVGSASYLVVQNIAASAPEWDEEQASFEVAQRLVTLYGAKAVRPKAHVRGASDIDWTVAAKVVLKGRETVFDAVSSSHNSVYAAASKFNDLARLEDAPNRVAIVQDKKAIKKYLSLLSQSAHVIEQGASDETVRYVTERAAA